MKSLPRGAPPRFPGGLPANQAGPIPDRRHPHPWETESGRVVEAAAGLPAPAGPSSRFASRGTEASERRVPPPERSWGCPWPLLRQPFGGPPFRWRFWTPLFLWAPPQLCSLLGGKERGARGCWGGREAFSRVGSGLRGRKATAGSCEGRQFPRGSVRPVAEDRAARLCGRAPSRERSAVSLNLRTSQAGGVDVTALIARHRVPLQRAEGRARQGATPRPSRPRRAQGRKASGAVGCVCVLSLLSSNPLLCPHCRSYNSCYGPGAGTVWGSGLPCPSPETIG